jgi:hypothetical protein
LASGRLPPVLAAEIPLAWRPTEDRRGPPRADPADSAENPLWRAPRIHGELLKLGFEVAQSIVAKYMVKRCGPPSQTWRTFVRNHALDIAAMDLFVVPTISFDLLYVFFIVRLARRDLVWINVTTHPTADWIARQITEAFPRNEAPRYLIRDRDRVYGTLVTYRLRAMGIRDKPIAPGSQQLIVLQRKMRGRVRFTNSDRVFFIQLYRWCPSVLKAMMIIRPETLVRWHRAGFRRYWRWKSHSTGRPAPHDKPASKERSRSAAVPDRKKTLGQRGKSIDEESNRAQDSDARQAEIHLLSRRGKEDEVSEPRAGRDELANDYANDRERRGDLHTRENKGQRHREPYKKQDLPV